MLQCFNMVLNLNFTIYIYLYIPLSLDILVSILALNISTFSFKTFIFYTAVNNMQSKSRDFAPNHDNFIFPMMQIFTGFSMTFNWIKALISWRFYGIAYQAKRLYRKCRACLLCLKIYQITFSIFA